MEGCGIRRGWLRVRGTKTKDGGGGGLEARRLKECLMRQTSRVGAINSIEGRGGGGEAWREEMAGRGRRKRAARNRNSTGRNSGRSEI